MHAKGNMPRKRPGAANSVLSVSLSKNTKEESIYRLLPAFWQLKQKEGNSLRTVREIDHKYFVVGGI
ncbi:hypothetical protein D3Z36_04310 [Lachnospiraceae bacterium]|nr:hypothetical protein [Lachnospiraceae bacterium]